MKTIRNDPDGQENQAMTQDNERYCRGLKVDEITYELMKEAAYQSDEELPFVG